MTENGTQELYGVRSVELDDMIDNGLVGYAKSVDMARRNSRSGSNPLVVKAVSANGTRKGDAVVSEEDAKLILSADVDSKFLSKCKIIFVVN